MSESVHPFRQKDIADRQRALMRDIGRKADSRPEVDNQGHPTGPPVMHEYDSLGKLLEPGDDGKPAA
jgi:hypothetical protein